MRTLHWVKQGLKMVAIVFFACFVYSPMMVLMQKNSLRLRDFLILSESFLLMLGGLFSVMFSTLIYTTDLPVVISCGATRRETFWGIQLGRGVYTLANLAIVGTMGLIASELPFRDLASAIPFVLSGYLLFHGLGGIVSILYAKFQKKGVISFCVGILCVLMGGSIGFLVAMNEDKAFSPPEFLPWLLLGSTAVFYGLVSAWEFRTIRRYNVKM